MNIRNSENAVVFQGYPAASAVLGMVRGEGSDSGMGPGLTAGNGRGRVFLRGMVGAVPQWVATAETQCQGPL